MNRVQEKRHGILLSVCYLSQLVIATAQPLGLPAGVLIPVLFAGTLVLQLLYRLLVRRSFFKSRLAAAAASLLFCFAAGYDFVRAERFYRTVTSQRLSFWWMIGCMLLIGWYAACCGRDTVLRAAQPVLAVLLLSLLILAVTGSYRLEELSFVRMDGVVPKRAGVVLLEYVFSGELLLWFYWNSHPEPSALPPQKKTGKEKGAAGWQAAVWLRFAVLSAFAVLGELALGARAAQTPQVFGVLSLVASGADAGHAGVLYHCIWLTALAVRVCAVCCTLCELGTRFLPGFSTAGRTFCAGVPLVGAAILWEALWRQDCLLWLSSAAAVLTAAALVCKKRGGELHEANKPV